jgi:Flp pilus assembly pilin Flp
MVTGKIEILETKRNNLSLKSHASEYHGQGTGIQILFPSQAVDSQHASRHTRAGRTENRRCAGAIALARLEVSMKSIMHRLWQEDEAQDIAEYAVMLAVILVIVVGTIRLIGGNANNVFSSVASSITQ